MPPTIVTYFSYSELAASPETTIDEFHSELKRFKRSSVLYVCAAINSILKSWQGKIDASTHDVLVRESFTPDIAERVIKAFHDPNDPRGFYHRQQLLFVAKEAIRVCDEAGHDPLSLPFWGGLGIVLLMANDLLKKPLASAKTGLQRVMNVVSDFIPVAEASGFFLPLHKVIRSYLLLSRFVPAEKRLDFNAAFEHTTGVPLSAYLAMCFAVFTKYFDMDIDKYRANPGNFILNQQWFRRVTMPQEYVERFLADTSASVEEFRQCLSRFDQGRNDFTCFRDRPLYREVDQMVVIDTAFLAEKADSGPFWRVHNSLDKNAREELHQLWGRAFEKYLNWLIAESVDKRSNFHIANPCYEDTGEEVCDALVICGDSAVFVEGKSATFTARAKYGHDPIALKNEIDEKLVATTEKKKGVAQLAAAIENVFGKRSHRPIQGVDVSKIRRVFPVMVTRDDLGAALALNSYFAERFREVFHRKSVALTVTPLFSMSAQDMEIACGYLKDAALTELLEARYVNDRNLLSTFLAVDNSVMARVGNRRCEVFWAAYREISKIVNQELFPRGELADQG